MWHLIIKFFEILVKNPILGLGILAFLMFASVSITGDPSGLILFYMLIGIMIAIIAVKRNKKRQQEMQREQEFNRITNPSPNTENYSPNGVVFGRKDGRTIAKPENKEGHILVVGTSGSGKTACIALPTLLSWQKRVFAIDIKGELYEEVSKRKANKKKNIKVFNPLKADTYGYNPFYMLEKSEHRAQDAEMIANTLIPIPNDTPDPFWLKSSRSMLAGAILHYSNSGYSFIMTIKEILTMESSKEKVSPAEEFVKRIKGSGTKECRYFVNSFVNLHERTLTSIFTVLCESIRLYVTNESLEKCLSKKEYITPEDLESGKDVYIQFPQAFIDQWNPLLNLIVKQFLTHFERRSASSSTPTLLLLDEFARLGKIEGITNALMTSRDKKVTICAIIQSLGNLDVIYGDKTTQVICDNCDYTAVLRVHDVKTQEYFSKRVGTYDKYRFTDTETVSPVLKTKMSIARAETTNNEPIIRPHEFATLRDIILLTQHEAYLGHSGFYRINKAPYYNHEY